MQVTLYNFGSNERIVHDANAVAVSLGIGQKKTIDDLPDVYYRMIKGGMDKGDPLLIMADDKEVPVELSAISALLKNLDSVDYTLLVEAYHQIIPVDLANRQPNRGTIRANLEEAGRLVAAGKPIPSTGLNNRVQIEEAADPEELQAELDKQQKGSRLPANGEGNAPDKLSRDAVGAALGLTLTPPAPAAGAGDEPSADVKPTRTRNRKPKAAAAKASDSPKRVARKRSA